MRVLLTHAATPLGRSLTEALTGVADVVPLGEGTVPASGAGGGAFDVVVHLGPAVCTSARLDDVVRIAVDETRAAVAAARAHGAPLVLVSTLAAIGRKKGLIAEDDPASSLFGGGAVRGKDLDVDGEIAACRREIDHARAAAAFADRQSQLADAVKSMLLDKGGATGGGAFREAFGRSADDEQRVALSRALLERAGAWQFATGTPWAARGYAWALAELIVAGAGGVWTIARMPDTLDDEDGALAHTLERVRAGMLRLPLLPTSRLEALPRAHLARAVATVVTGTALAKQGGLVHVTAGDPASQKSGPLLGARLSDLIDLHLRRRRAHAGADADATSADIDMDIDIDNGTPAMSLSARALSVDTAGKRSMVVDAGVGALQTGLAMLKGLVPLDRLPEPARAVWDDAAAAFGSVLEPSAADRAFFTSPPFFADDVRFSQRGLRLFSARAGTPFTAADLAWRTTLLDTHLPTLDEHRTARARATHKLPRPAYDSLAHLLTEISDRYGPRPAMTLLAGDDVVVVSYRELLDRARAVALRLQRAGVGHGDRVLLAGANHPAWGVVAFGVFLARATVVPLDPGLDIDAVKNITRKARPTLAVVDKAQREKWAGALAEPVLDLQLTAVEGPGIDAAAPLPSGDDVASILFTSGTTGEPKGVQLTHKNFCALLGSLQAIFPVGRGDRMLSVLPLHHTFEFSCGLLMPLASGAHIYTPDALTGERVLFALKKGRITALVGVPALWQLLERRITKQAAERGDLIKSVLDALLAANRAFAKQTGLSFGKIALKPIHDELGGHLRTLISGGSALPPSVHALFQGLGLPLAEGYGLTEAAPVLTVAEGILGAPAGTVGRAIPGVELRILDPDATTGVGEIWARAPNVMKGYFEDEAATLATLEDGWLKTGDLGLIDGDGRLRIVGRSKDVVVTASGENVYLDDIEKKLEKIDGVAELTLLGLPDPKGGERLACAWVLAPESNAGDALKHLQQRIQKLPGFARPAVVERVEGPLPLTATRKVKRKEVRKTLEQILAAKEAEGTAEASETPLTAVRAAIALVSGVEVKKLSGATRLPQDLGFDSLMWTELGSALKPLCGDIDPELLVSKESVAEIENLVRAQAQRAAESPLGNGAIDVDSGERIDRKKTPVDAIERFLLPLIKPAGRAAITLAQREAYRTLFHATVSGRAFIPHNRSSIVIANHTSHLDTGLVKFALDTYGKDLRPLAAKDYFFEGARPKVAFFEHFTNLVPIDRETGSGLAFEQARAVVERGHVVLIFPEGTRREDGTLGGFKPLVARLSLITGVDVLPIWMKGNYEALPRGTHVPHMDARDLEAHIGPPLEAKHLARLTAHLPPVQQARAATDILRRAIVALSEGRMLELSRVPSLDALERGLVSRPAA